MSTEILDCRLTEAHTVTLTLRKEQRIDYNHWKCTIHGEDRIVTMQKVQYITIGDIQKAMLSFKASEIIGVEIVNTELITQ